MHFYERLNAQLDERKALGNFRELPLVSFSQDNIMLDSVPYIDLSSNDYLCIARDAKFLKTFLSTMMDTSRSGSSYADNILTSAISTGSTGSRLLTGNHLNYAYCEDLISSLFNGALLSEQQKRREKSYYAKYHENICFNPKLKKVSGDLYEVNEQCYQNVKGVKADLDIASTLKAFKEASKEPMNKDSSLWDVDKENKDFATYQTPFYERECLYINSGFDANEGIISTLFTKGDLLLVDRLAHASIIDGMLKSKAKSIRFAHNDIEHLKSLLDEYHDEYNTICIITESIFSMDGDFANLQQIVELKRQYKNVLLYVDEAHSFGLFGEDGLGLCRELEILSDVDLLMGTLSKAIGSQGAFLLCAPTVKSYLVNFMRPLIFSTALPPVNITFSMYVIGLLKTNALQYKRDYLRQISRYLHLNLSELGIKASGSQIQPLITGDNEKALLASKIFRRAGLLAMPIRHPTVPKSQARLRLALNCNLRLDDVDLISSIVKHYRKLFIA